MPEIYATPAQVASEVKPLKTRVDYVYEKAGFAEIVGGTGKTHIVTVRNTTCDGGGYDEMDDYFFLPPRSEVYGGIEISGVNEGSSYPYYADYSDLNGAGTGADSNRIKYKNGSAQYWWMRTPISGRGDAARYVGTTGSVYGNSVNDSYGVAPACCII